LSTVILHKNFIYFSSQIGYFAQIPSGALDAGRRKKAQKRSATGGGRRSAERE